MNENLDVVFDEILEKKLAEFDELELTNPRFGDAADDIVAMLNVRIAADKVNIEEIEKDDQRVIDKEKLEFDKKEAKWNRALKIVGYGLSAAAFAIGLNFEKTGYLTSNLVRNVVKSITGSIGHLR